jgi:hypothetical protein
VDLLSPKYSYMMVSYSFLDFNAVMTDLTSETREVLPSTKNSAKSNSEFKHCQEELELRQN